MTPSEKSSRSRSTEAIPSHPAVLCVAGMDPTGGAGLLADVAALASLSVRAAGVITANTRQRPAEPVQVFPADPVEVDEVLSALLADISFQAVKIGMLATGPVARVVGERLSAVASHLPWVVDPVMEAGAGGRLVDEEAVEILLGTILPSAAIVTPNIPEAARLLAMDINSVAEMEEAALQLRRLGARYVLIKGGHLPGDPVDVLAGPDGVQRFTGERIPAGRVHGTGCTLSALLAGHLAKGAAVAEAVERSRRQLCAALAAAWAPQPHGWKFLGPCP